MKKILTLNKKGGMFDIILAMIFSFIIVICLVIFTFAQNTIHDGLINAAPNIQKNLGSQTNFTFIVENTVGKVSTAYTTFKWISVLFIFGYFFSILVSAFLVKSHPAWFVGYMLFVIISVFISIHLSNSYQALMESPILADIFLTGFFEASWIFIYFPYWVTVFGILSGILMYVNLGTGDYY